MECLHISTITSYYEHTLEAGLEKLIEEHVMVCQECWKKIIAYSFDNPGDKNDDAAQGFAETAGTNKPLRVFSQKEVTQGKPSLSCSVAEKVFA